MEQASSIGGTSPARPAARGEDLGGKLVRVAWLAIVLGLVMEALLLLVAAGFGLFRGFAPAVADLLKQVSWSVLVCGGLALGTAVSKLRTPLMGLLGLISAPIAFNVARSLHEGTAAALDAPPAAAGTASVLLIALVKGIEYGCLGAAIAVIGRRAWGGLSAHAGAGLAVGVVFGGMIVALTYAAAVRPLAVVALVSQGVNEMVFPVGCALVLYSAAALGERAAGPG